MCNGSLHQISSEAAQQALGGDSRKPARASSYSLGDNRVRIVLVLLFLAIGGQALACDPNTFVSSSAKPLPPEAFRGITHFMLVEAILEKLGPAARDIGSGLHVLEWDLTDGRVFRMSASPSCGKPYRVGFSEKPPNKPLQPIARENARSG